MTSFVIGDTTVHRVVDLELTLPVEGDVPTWCVPTFAPPGGGVLLAFSAWALEVEGAKVVIDPWLANDDPRSRPDAAATADRLLGALADAGFAPDEVDLVVNTHLDGIGWNTRPDGRGGWEPSFPRARYLWSVTQLASNRDDERLGPLRDAGMVDAVDPPVEPVPGLTLEDGPGHEPGHLVARLRRGGDEAVFAGHLFISPLQVADPSMALDEDPEQATATRTTLLAGLAERGGLLLADLLGGPGGGRVHRAGPGSWRLA